jgi:hypothetical protein
MMISDGLKLPIALTEALRGQLVGPANDPADPTSAATPAAPVPEEPTVECEVIARHGLFAGAMVHAVGAKLRMAESAALVAGEHAIKVLGSTGLKFPRKVKDGLPALSKNAPQFKLLAGCFYDPATPHVHASGWPVCDGRRCARGHWVTCGRKGGGPAWKQLASLRGRRSSRRSSRSCAQAREAFYGAKSPSLRSDSDARARVSVPTISEAKFHHQRIEFSHVRS